MNHLVCPSCKKYLKGGWDLAGKDVRCPSCLNVFHIPAADEAGFQSPAPPPAPPAPIPEQAAMDPDRPELDFNPGEGPSHNKQFEVLLPPPKPPQSGSSGTWVAVVIGLFFVSRILIQLGNDRKQAPNPPRNIADPPPRLKPWVPEKNVLDGPDGQARVWTLLGFQSYEQGKIDEADKKCRMALRASPTHAPAIALSGLIHLARNQFDEAEAAGRLAVKHDPGEPKGHAVISMAYLCRGKFEQSLAKAEDILQLDPSSPLGHACRGMAFRRMGEFDRAINELSVAVERNPKPEWKKELELARHRDRERAAP